MSALIHLASGAFVHPGAIQMVDARALMRPHIDPAGVEWPAVVIIETRRQVLRVPCATFEDAEDLRDEIGDLVNRYHEETGRAAQRNRGPTPAPAPALPALAVAS